MFGMVLVYLLRAVLPLHLHFDRIRYYNIKDCLEFGCDPNSFAATELPPFGYTGLLIVLSSWVSSIRFSIVFVNCLYILLVFTWCIKIFASQLNPFVFGVLALFNWTLIKFVAHPLSEMQYIFFSAVSLYCFIFLPKSETGFTWGLRSCLPF